MARSLRSSMASISSAAVRHQHKRLSCVVSTRLSGGHPRLRDCTPVAPIHGRSTRLHCIWIAQCSTGFLVNTLLIGSTGSTVGKWIYGVRVTRADRKRIGFRLALKREFFVLVRGIALGIPLLNLFAMLNCYNYLAEHSTTRWDERCATQVSHRPNTPGQALARFLATIVLILVVVASNARA